MEAPGGDAEAPDRTPADVEAGRGAGGGGEAASTKKDVKGKAAEPTGLVWLRDVQVLQEQRTGGLGFYLKSQQVHAHAISPTSPCIQTLCACIPISPCMHTPMHACSPRMRACSLCICILAHAFL